tara:strand:+ start:468 stop:890 length:423 start_codon:yes stop_codon:yes gene_type:complete
MKTLTIVLLFLFIPMVIATSLEELNLEEVEGQKIPGPLKIALGNQKVNLIVSGLDTEITLGIVTQKGVVVKAGLEKLENPTLIVKVNEETINRIESSANPLLTMHNALKSEEIQYQAKGLLNKIRMKMVITFLKVAGSFA